MNININRVYFPWTSYGTHPERLPAPLRTTCTASSAIETALVMFAIVWFPALICLCSGYFFMSVAPLSTQFMSLFGVGYAGLSFFLSGLLWAHSFVQLPAGLILDRIGAYKGFLIAITIAFIANVLPFLAVDSIMLATGLRFLAGLSSGSLFLIGIKMIGMQAPPDKAAVAQGIQGAAFCLGTMLPFITLPHLGTEAWRFSYIIPAVLSVLTVALSRLLPEKIRKTGKSGGGGASKLFSALKTVSISMPIWTLGIFHGFSYGTLNNLGQWLPSILADIHGNSTAVAWSLATGTVLLIGTLSRASGSTLLKWLSKNTIISISVLAIGILYITLGLIGNVYLGLAVGFGLAILGGCNYGSIFSMTGNIMSPMYLATAAGFMNMIANIANVLLTIILGTVREYTGSFSMALIAAGITALSVWVIGSRIISRIRENTIPASD